MSILSQPQKPQNFTVDGVKFFNEHLQKIRCDSMVTDHPITTSEIAVFMILHLYTDEMGQIRTLTKDPSISDRKQLCISNLSIEHDLTYETVKKAFDSLLKRGYIAEVHTSKGMHYEIVGYGKLNESFSNPLNTESPTYFRLPSLLFQEKFFGTLIKQRYHKGPLLILELFQYFTVQAGTTRRNAEDIQRIVGTRKMEYLKKTLNTTAKRVRNFLSIIRNVFSFKPIDIREKQPSQNRISRKRTFVQIAIKKYNFSLNPACFKRTDEKGTQKIYARTKNEMAARVKNARIPLKWRDLKDIDKSISRMVNISVHLDIVNKSKNMLDYTISKVADILESLHITGELDSIKSIGAFVNKSFTKAFEEFQKHYISIEERMEIGVAYHNIFGEYPSFLITE
ncbi:hypothetical protein [Bacillus massiliglaciei]|uniref:hypothetical protein n=1 Tax=Bacillus massiliglaciei TaxID=1816693 RepID=UPI000DA60824|nr:hypothetical protein [Bacillus massiliglaciei]